MLLEFINQIKKISKYGNQLLENAAMENQHGKTQYKSQEEWLLLFV